jgi:tetratricopeptide (TPR) repeat protein
MVTKLRSRNTLEQDVNSLICRDKYDEAIALAKKELRRLPRSCYENWRKHWYVAHISSAYYEKRNYKVALKWGKKAFNMFPYCPLVLWHYAGALFRIGHVRAAINRYFDIYN